MTTTGWTGSAEPTDLTGGAASSPEAGPAASDPRRWKALAVLLLVQFMLILDISVVNVALPTIQRDLGFSREGLTWVVDGYVLMAGSLLLLGGRLSDALGRRRTFLAGVVVFGLASVACGLAQNPGVLVASRFVQGVGEALAAPAAFGLIALLFTESTERAKAIGFFGGISGLAGTSGPILSGLLVEQVSWRYIFLINIPVAVFALAAVPRLVAGSHSRPRVRVRDLDLPGAVLVTIGLTATVYGLIEAASNTWTSAAVLVPLLGGLAVVVLFVGYQQVARSPLVPLRSFAERTRLTSNLVTLLFYSVFLSQFVLTTLYLQDVLGFRPLKAGLAFLPFGIAIGAAIGLATNLLPRVGLRPIVVAGLLVAAGGTLLFTRIEPGGSYLTQVMPASVLIAVGSGLLLPALSNGAVHRVTEDDAGLASGVQQALQQIGGAVGLAVLITLAVRRAGDAALAGTDAAVATANGYRLALQVGTAVLLSAAVLAATLLRPGVGRGAASAAGSH